MNEVVIKVENLQKKYKDKIVVEDVNFEVYPSEIMGLLGPNGAGKTTTLKMITGLTKCDRGNVYIKGYSIENNTKEAMKHLGATLDIPSFYKELTGYENLLYSASLYKDIPETHIKELIYLVGLEGKEKQYVKNYSTGMRQRLGLARALLANPDLVILDEPANGLDPQGMIQLYELIRRLAIKKKVAFIVSSHLLHDMEGLCTDVLILNEGKSIVQGKTKELLSGPKDIIRISSKDTPKLIKVLHQIKGIEVLRNIGYDVEIWVKGTTINEILTHIVNGEVELMDFHVKQVELQDLFLRLIGA